MAALLKKTMEKGSDALSSRKKQKKNVIHYQEFTHEEEEEEESKEHSYSGQWEKQVINEDLYGQEEDDEGNQRLGETGYLYNQYQNQQDRNQLIENQMHDVELSEDYLQMKRSTRIVKSDAWPAEASSQNEAKAAVHKFLQDHCDQINIENVYYRQLTGEDVLEVRNLNEEWFPLSYPDSFYQKLFRHNYIAIGCFAKLKSTSEVNQHDEYIEKEVILGTILVRVQFGDDQVAQLYQMRDRTHDGTLGSWFRWLKSIVQCKEYVGAYIMTIGVVDECRRLGLGTQLLNKAIQVLKKYWSACEILYLHVVDYNESAIRFYLNDRNKFNKHSVIKDHYVIMNKNYNAILLYRDISKEESQEGVIESLNKTAPLPNEDV